VIVVKFLPKSVTENQAKIPFANLDCAICSCNDKKLETVEKWMSAVWNFISSTYLQ